jgi:hypothetical protein
MVSKWRSPLADMDQAQVGPVTRGQIAALRPACSSKRLRRLINGQLHSVGLDSRTD